MPAQNNNSTSGSVGQQTTVTPFQVFGASDAAGNIHFNVADTTCQINISANGNPEVTITSHAATFTVDTFTISSASSSGSLAFATDGKMTLGGSSGLYLNINSASGMLKVNGTQVVTVRQAAVTAPSGGATIDSQARTAINDVIARLQAHGLIS